jgi:ribosome-associated translation inhibitor RaiA
MHPGREHPEEEARMQIPLQITFRDMPPSPALEARIREAAAKLDRHVELVTSCRVAVEAPPRHHQHGGIFRVRIDLTVPGREIVIGRSHADRAEHASAHVAVRDAFRAALRALEDHARIRRHEIKAHESAPAA